jgi:hypothetical protein
MNPQIPMYRDQFQSAIQEITSRKGKIRKIFGNTIYFTDSAGEASVFTPTQTDSGAMFVKVPLKEFEQGEKI